MPLTQVGLDFVVRGVSYALGRAQRYTSAIKAMNSEQEKAVKISTMRSQAFQRLANDQQIALIAEEQGQNKAKIKAISNAESLGMISTAEAERNKAEIRLAEKRTLETIRQSKEYEKLSTQEQKNLVQEKVLEVQTKRNLLGITALATGVAIYAGALTKLSAESVKLATINVALARGLKTVSTNMGVSAEETAATVKQMQKMQFTEQKSTQTLSKLLAVRSTNADALKLTAVANDVAAARGQDYNLVLDAMVDAIENVTVTQLREIGLSISATQVFKAYADAHDKTIRSLTTEEQRRAIINQMLSQGTIYSGAYAESLSDQDQQMRKLKNEITKLATTYGTMLLPAVTDVTTKTADFVESINELDPAMQRFLSKSAAIVAAVGGISSALLILSPIIKLIIGGIVTVFTTKWGFVLGAIAAITGLATSKLLDVNAEVEKLDNSLAKETKANALNAVRDGAEKAAEALEAAIVKQEELAQKTIASTEVLKRPLNDALVRIKLASDVVADGFYEMNKALRDLDRPLWPIEDELERIAARIAPIIIPIQRANRILQRQLTDIKTLYDEEKERAERLKDELDDQVDTMRELLDLDKDRLKSIQQDIFMEELRNKILKQKTSGYLLELKSAAAAEQDNIALRQKEIEAANELKDTQKDVENETLKAYEAQIAAIEKQIAASERQIGLQQEAVTYQQEELELARAAQVEDRLRQTEIERNLTDKQNALQREEELINRQIAAYDRIIEQQNIIIQDMQSIREEGSQSAVLNLYPQIEALQKIADQTIAAEEALQSYYAKLEESPITEVAEKAINYINKIEESLKPLIGIFKKIFPTSLQEDLDKLTNKFLIIQDLWSKVVEAYKKYKTIMAPGTDVDAINLLRYLWNGKLPNDYIPKNYLPPIEAQSIKQSSPSVSDISSFSSTMRQPNVVNNYSTVGPTVQVSANYASTQSASSVLNDVQTLLALV